MLTDCPLPDEKGMYYNPQTLRWEGNENMVAHFDDTPLLQSPTPLSHHRSQVPHVERTAASSTSPSRPGLIAHIPTANTPNIQVQNGMVYDPHQMKWLKVRGGRHISGTLSPSVTDGDDNDDDEDAFAGIEDLKEEAMPTLGSAATAGLASPVSLAAGGGSVGDVHEEFDLGPRFIQLQRDEELAWRRHCESWFVNDQSRPDDGRWRYAIRDIVPREALGGF